MAERKGKGLTAELGERLRSEREKYGEREGRRFTQRDAANLLNMDDESYRAYEYGRARLPEARARILASEFKIDYRSLLSLEFPASPSLTGTASYADATPPRFTAPQPWQEIPFIGGVGANRKPDWVDPIEPGEAIEVPADMANVPGKPPTRFACEVIGDSCAPLLEVEDIAVFERTALPKKRHIMVYRSPDGQLTIKQVLHNGRIFVLHPLNPEYEDEPAEGTVLGYLIGIVRQIGSGRWTRYDPYGIIPDPDPMRKKSDELL